MQYIINAEEDIFDQTHDVVCQALHQAGRMGGGVSVKNILMHPVLCRKLTDYCFLKYNVFSFDSGDAMLSIRGIKILRSLDIPENEVVPIYEIK